MTPQIGEGSAGDGVDAVRVSTVLGDRDGPVGTAWTLALATPSAGHSPFIVVAKPSLPVVPFTLLVPSVAISGTRHGELTRGAAQAGVAAAVLDLRMDDPDGLVCLIASVWLSALADDEEAVFANTREATKAALQLGAAAGPWHGNLAAIETPENPDFRRARRELPT
jgi:5,6,7,8-tetrahydromethanopterin hydro-lyase